MRKAMALWDRLDGITKAGIVCGAIYLLLYVIIDILEALLGIVIG